MKTNIIKIDGIEFGITDDFLVCPYTEETLKNKWIENVTSIIQKAENTYMGTYLVVKCEKLSVVYDEKDMYLCTPAEIKMLLSEKVEVTMEEKHDKRGIIVITKDLEKVDKILIRLK